MLQSFGVHTLIQVSAGIERYVTDADPLIVGVPGSFQQTAVFPLVC